MAIWGYDKSLKGITRGLPKDSADATLGLVKFCKINAVGDSTYSEWGDLDNFYTGVSLFKADNRQKLVFKSGKVPWYKTNKKDGEVLKEYGISNRIAFVKK